MSSCSWYRFVLRIEKTDACLDYVYSYGTSTALLSTEVYLSIQDDLAKLQKKKEEEKVR